jgi:hypothetical protein
MDNFFAFVLCRQFLKGGIWNSGCSLTWHDEKYSKSKSSNGSQKPD